MQHKGTHMVASLVSGQFNDSFTPIMDGVGIAVQNYAYWLNRKLSPSYVVTPSFPGYVDAPEPPVLRYISLPVPIRPPYRAGLPDIDIAFQTQLRQIHFALVHAHCPFTSGLLALRIAALRHIPIVATFHTKYRDDLAKLAPSNAIVDLCIDGIVAFYRAVDHVWVPNKATLATLRDYGYDGPCNIVPNGTDIEISATERPSYRHLVDSELGTGPDDTVFLYVGQHRWEKNLALLIEALRGIKDRGRRFRMVFVGQGYAADAMRAQVHELGLDGEVTFVGVVLEREKLKRYYARADLLLFPSVYDNAPLTVREAAACFLPAVLVRNSSAAEGVVDGQNGFLAANDAQDYAATVAALMERPALLRAAGEGAHGSLYQTWEQIVEEVAERYQAIVRGYQGPRTFWDGIKPIHDLQALLNDRARVAIADRRKAL
jgi:1,2-diacylglycerol 3-alpha-glucosyltransferase